MRRVVVEVAKRFVAHEAVRRWRIVQQYGKHGDAWKMPPMPPEAVAQVEAEYQHALKSYGSSFNEDYEWARPALLPKKGRMYFSDLEEAFGGAPWRVKYAVASEFVHAGDSGTLLDDDHGWDNPYLSSRWTTPNGGVPGAQAAMSLVSITKLSSWVALIQTTHQAPDSGPAPSQP